MTPAIPAASASAAPRRAGKGAAPAIPAWSAQPPSRTAAHANTAFAGAPRIPRPPSPQAARAPALFAPSPPLAHAAQTVPQPQAIPTQTHPIHRSSIKVGNDARTLKGVSLRARPGRTVQDFCGLQTAPQAIRNTVDLYLHQQGLDTST